VRRIVAFTLLVTSALLSQTDKNKFKTPNDQSPPKETSVTINGKEIWIVYHAPSVRGRKVFGGTDALQADNTIWRMGADQATFLHTDAALDLNGLNVPAGEYTLFIDLDGGKWSLIVNKQTGQWGIGPGRIPAQDLGRTAMTMSKPPALVEQHKITLASAGGNKGTLKVEWEHVSASVPFTVK